MSIIRQNKYLSEIIEILDNHRAKYRVGDIGDDEARAALSSSDNEWIDGECYHSLIDTRYFLSNYYAIRTEDKGFQGLYPFFDSQEILYEELRKLEKKYGRVRAIVDKARRMGYTTYMVGEFLHKTVIRYKHTNTVFVSQDEDGAKYNMEMYESAFSFLPWWMQPRVMKHENGKVYCFDEPDENLRTSRPGLKNWVYADNANRPSGVGRGKGFRCAMLDELAHWKDSSQLSKSLLRTFVASDGFYVMGSTANGRNDAWHNLWRRAEAGSIDWHTIFIPFYRRPKTYSLPIPKGEVFTLTTEEIEMVEQIKKKDGITISNETINWMRKTKEEFIATDGDDMLFDQEYAITAETSFQNAIISAIPRGIINRFSKRTVQPKWIGEISFDFTNWRPQLHMKPLRDGEEALYPETENRLHMWEKPQPGERYCLGCLPDGEEVRTNNGHKPIETVSDTDLLLDKDGKYVKITSRMRRLYSGEMVSVRPFGASMPTRLTPEHPVWVVEDTESDGMGKWVKAGQLKEGQWMRLPIAQHETIRGSELMSKWPIDCVRVDFRIPEHIMWDVDFWLIVGLWLGDGWSSENSKQSVNTIGFNALKEQDVAAKVRKVLEDLNRRPTNTRIKDNCLYVTWNSVQWERFLHTNFGNRAHNKHIPQWVLRLPYEHRRALLYGYFLADGNITSAGFKGEKRVDVACFVSVSRNLLVGIQDLLMSIGLSGPMNMLRKGGVHIFHGKGSSTRPTYQIRMSRAGTNKLMREFGEQYELRTREPGRFCTYVKDGFLYSKIHKIEKSEFFGYVNNFETETHSYCSGLIATHNCDVALGQKGGDYSSCTVMKISANAQLDEQVAQWHGLMDPHNLTDIVLALCWYYNEALAAVEVNSFGMATNTRLMRDYEYENLYRFKRMDRLKHFMTDIVGFWTDYKSKRTLISFCSKMMLDDQVLIRDKYLIDEFRDFTEDGADGEGAHDDFVMSFMIALYCGHEGEFEERRNKPQEAKKDQNNYIVYVRGAEGMPVVAFQSVSPFDAEKFSKKKIGSWIVNEHGAMADLKISKKGEVRTVRVPADFQNTAYSPIHDKPGTRQEMFDEGIPAEMIDQQSIADFEARQEEEDAVNDNEAWKYV